MTEGVESTLAVSGHHLGDLDSEGIILVTLSNGVVAGVTDGTLVRGSGSVLLGKDHTCLLLIFP